MSAAVLTVEAAKQAKIQVIENGRGTQAVHDVVVAQRSPRWWPQTMAPKGYGPGASRLYCITDLVWRRRGFRA